MPKISIILPTYNVEKYIARALDSCINQTLKDIEIIVVDDKGQDNSIKIAKEYMSKDDRIKIIDNIVNQGVLKSRINGANNSSSDLLMFLDPDDELELNTCEILFNAIQNNDVDIVVFNIKIIDGDRVDDIWKNDGSVNCVICTDEYKNSFSKFSWSMNNKLYKKNIVFDSFNKILLNNFNHNFLEDFLFMYFITKQISKAYIINNSLYHYHINKSSITGKKDLKIILNNIRIFEHVIKILKNYQDDFSIKLMESIYIEYVYYGLKYIKKYKYNSIKCFAVYIKFRYMKKAIKLRSKFNKETNAKNINNNSCL